jgi:hypothetical protein
MKCLVGVAHLVVMDRNVTVALGKHYHKAQRLVVGMQGSASPSALFAHHGLESLQALRKVSNLFIAVLNNCLQLLRTWH